MFEYNALSKEELLERGLLPLHEEEKQKIQAKIDQLNFLKGYKYQVETIKTALPAIDQAPFDTIYVQISGYNKVVRRKAAVEAVENDDSPLDDTVSPLINNASLLEHDKSAIYITSITDNNVAFSWGDNNTDTLTLSDTLIKLLPGEDKNKDQISKSATLLKAMYNSLDLNATENNILICSVRHYSGDYKTTIIKAEDLEFQRLAKKSNLAKLSGSERDEKEKELKQTAKKTKIPKEFVLNTNITNMIVDMFVKKGYANHGLVNMNDNQQFLPDDYKISERKGTTRLLSAALTTEASFAYLEYITSLPGWIIVSSSFAASEFLSISGTAADFVVNLWTISPHADADALALRELVEVSKNMKWIIPFINFASEISYFDGGAGNAIGIVKLGWGPLLYPVSPALFYGFAVPTVALVSYIGRTYYQAFNIKHLRNTLDILDRYFSAKKEHIDHDWSRETMVFIIVAFVIAFRSMSFGGIGVLVLEALKIRNAWAHLFVGLVGTFFTAIQIFATRWYRVNTVWCNNDFALLHPNEKQAAWDALKKSWPSIITNCVLTSDTLESLIMASSAPFFTNFSNSYLTYLFACIGITYVLNTCLAQIRRTINNNALEKIENYGINIQDRKDEQHDIETGAGADENYNPLIPDLYIEPEEQKDFMRVNIAGAMKAYGALDKAYLVTWTVFLTAAAFCAYSVLTRGLGFLGYIDILNSMLKPVVTIQPTQWQIIGLGLLLGPPNMHNMFDMFYANMSEYMARKASEAEMTYHNQRSDDQQSFPSWACSNLSFFINPCKGWAFSKEAYLGQMLSKIPGSEYVRNLPFFHSYTGESLYTKGGLSYTSGEVKKHLNDKITSLQARLPAPGV